MRQLLGIVQLVAAIALMALAAQGALFVLAGRHRERNVFYQVLRIVPSPFVRLTLAAFQPVAIAGAYISGPVHLDPIKLGTDRTVVLEAATSGPNFGVKLTVTGVEHKGILNAAQTIGFLNLWRITWQEADPAIADQDLRWVDTGSQTLLFRNAGPADTTSGKRR